MPFFFFCHEFLDSTCHGPADTLQTIAVGLRNLHFKARSIQDLEALADADLVRVWAVSLPITCNDSAAESQVVTRDDSAVDAREPTMLPIPVRCQGVPPHQNSSKGLSETPVCFRSVGGSEGKTGNAGGVGQGARECRNGPGIGKEEAGHRVSECETLPSVVSPYWILLSSNLPDTKYSSE